MTESGSRDNWRDWMPLWCGLVLLALSSMIGMFVWSIREIVEIKRGQAVLEQQLQTHRAYLHYLELRTRKDRPELPEPPEPQKPVLPGMP